MDMFHELNQIQAEYQDQIEEKEKAIKAYEHEITELKTRTAKIEALKDQAVQEKDRLIGEFSQRMKDVLGVEKRSLAGSEQVEEGPDDDDDDEEGGIVKGDHDKEHRRRLKIQVLHEFGKSNFELLDARRCQFVRLSGYLTRRDMDELSGLSPSIITKLFRGETEVDSTRRCISWVYFTKIESEVDTGIQEMMGGE